MERIDLAFQLYKRKAYIGDNQEKEEKSKLKSIETIYSQAQYNQVLWMLEALLQENVWGDA